MKYDQIFYQFLLSLLIPFAQIIATTPPVHVLNIFGPEPTEQEITQTVATINAAGVKVAWVLYKQLNNYTDFLLAQLQKTFATPEQWEQIRQEVSDLICSDTLFSTSTLIVRTTDEHPGIWQARALLAQYGVNQSAVEITTVNNENHITSVAAGQGFDGTSVIHALTINVPQFEKRLPEAQDAILRHAIWSLMNYGILYQAAIETLFERIGIEPEVYLNNPTYQDYCKLYVYCADLLASADSLNVARATEQGLAALIQEHPHMCKFASVSSPSLQNRYAAVVRLRKYLEAEARL